MARRELKLFSRVDGEIGLRQVGCDERQGGEHGAAEVNDRPGPIRIPHLSRERISTGGPRSVACGHISYIISIILKMMSGTDAVTSIPVHQSTLRALRGSKTANQTWDDFLLALADDFISPSLRADLDRRLRSERIVAGADMKKEFAAWRRRRART